MEKYPHAEQIEAMLARLLPRVEKEVAPWGNFAPVSEEFVNTDKSTQHLAGKFRLKVYKMPDKDVPDPAKRFLQAEVVEPEGCYMANLLVGSGDKEDIIRIIQSPEFRLKLYEL